jgi:hypothetical protein
LFILLVAIGLVSLLLILLIIVCVHCVRRLCQRRPKRLDVREVENTFDETEQSKQTYSNVEISKDHKSPSERNSELTKDKLTTQNERIDKASLDSNESMDSNILNSEDLESIKVDDTNEIKTNDSEASTNTRLGEDFLSKKYVNLKNLNTNNNNSNLMKLSSGQLNLAAKSFDMSINDEIVVFEKAMTDDAYKGRVNYHQNCRDKTAVNSTGSEKVHKSFASTVVKKKLNSLNSNLKSLTKN